VVEHIDAYIKVYNDKANPSPGPRKRSVNAGQSLNSRRTVARPRDWVSERRLFLASRAGDLATPDATSTDKAAPLKVPAGRFVMPRSMRRSRLLAPAPRCRRCQATANAVIGAVAG
jgi:hypothetical protein